MNTTIDDIDRFIADAQRMEQGAARTALCEEAVQLADAHGDIEKAFEARTELVNSACFGGQPDVMLVAFTWLVATADKHPTRFGDYSQQYHLLWMYKWVLGALPDFPHIPKSQILEVLADMRKRYQKFGSTLHGYYSTEWGVFEDLGDKERVTAAYKKLNRTPGDILSNCAACDQDGRITYHRYFNRYELAVAASEPILVGQMRCATVPQRTYAKLLYPLFRLGRIEEAMRHHRAQYRAIAGRVGFLGYVEDHVEFLALTGNYARAVRIAERHLPMVLTYPAPSMQRDWFRTLRLLFALLVQSDQKRLKFRFPDGHPMKTADDRTTPAELFDYFDREARTLAAKFDARDGHNWHTDALDRLGKQMKLVRPYPYSVRRSDQEDT